MSILRMISSSNLSISAIGNAFNYHWFVSFLNRLAPQFSKSLVFLVDLFWLNLNNYMLN